MNEKMKIKAAAKQKCRSLQPNAMGITYYLQFTTLDHLLWMNEWDCMLTAWLTLGRPVYYGRHNKNCAFPYNFCHFICQWWIYCQAELRLKMFRLKCCNISDNIATDHNWIHIHEFSVHARISHSPVFQSSNCIEQTTIHEWIVFETVNKDWKKKRTIHAYHW